VDDHGSGTSTRTVAIAPQAWSEAPIGLIKKDSTITNTVTGAAWVVSVILAVLLYVVVSRKLAEAMATHANDMSLNRGKLPPICRPAHLIHRTSAVVLRTGRSCHHEVAHGAEPLPREVAAGGATGKRPA